MKKNKKFSFKGKVIRVNLDKKFFYYTIKEVKLLNDTHLCFVDKFDIEKGVRLIDIVEILEG